MMISKIILKNWRNFREVDVDLSRRTFLVGPNACGKSNFLDAIRFLRDIAKSEGGGLQKAVRERGGISKIRCLAARHDPQVEIEVHLSDPDNEKIKWRYAISIRQKPRGHRQPYLEYEKVWKNDVLILERPEADDKKDELRLTQTHLEQINMNDQFREIVTFFESISYVHLVPQFLRHPELFNGTNGKEDPFGKNFLEKVALTPEKTRKSRLKKIEKALQSAVPQLKKLMDTKDVRGAPHLEAIYNHWRPKGAKQNEEQFSDGTLRLIGLLWALLEGDALLLLEEPELSLHTAIINKLAPLMWRLQYRKKRQVVISTHSPDLLSDKGIGGEEVLMLKPDVEGTSVKLASAIQEVRDLLEGGMSIAEAVLPQTAPDDIIQLSWLNE